MVPYTRNCSPCYKTKCSKRKVCPFDKHNQTVEDYASKLAMAQNPGHLRYKFRPHRKRVHSAQQCAFHAGVA